MAHRIEHWCQAPFSIAILPPVARFTVTHIADPGIDLFATAKRLQDPLYFSKGLISLRTGRIRVWPFSITNSTRSPAERPMRLRISGGTVTWPLLLMVLEYFIFTLTPYSKEY